MRTREDSELIQRLEDKIMLLEDELRSFNKMPDWAGECCTWTQKERGILRDFLARPPMTSLEWDFLIRYYSEESDRVSLRITISQIRKRFAAAGFVGKSIQAIRGRKNSYECWYYITTEAHAFAKKVFLK